MSLLHGAGHGLDEAFRMFWDTLWALVVGFALSGAVQAFVSRGEMQRTLGDHRPRTLAKAGLLGAASSSCSYASAALAKTLFARGADLTASLVFMVASTNLVVELGIVLWLLIGWQLALAELVGGAVMIALLGLAVPRAIPRRWAEEARARLADTADRPAAGAHLTWRERLRSRAGWRDASGYTISDLSMLRRELVVGFVVAGFLAALVPESFWRSLFLTGHGFGGDVENVVLGPFLAIVSFVCSVGNVPLAAALWKGGISFGGVVSFVFADLITLPLLAIYRRYYGWPIAVRILGVFWAVMSLSGLTVDLLFRALAVPMPHRPHGQVASTGLGVNATTVLDLVALAVLAGLLALSRTRGGDSRFARDPVCGMQVEKAHAPARIGDTFFCCDGCAARWRRGDEPELLSIGRRPPGG